MARTRVLGDHLRSVLLERLDEQDVFSSFPSHDRGADGLYDHGCEPHLVGRSRSANISTFSDALRLVGDALMRMHAEAWIRVSRSRIIIRA